MKKNIFLFGLGLLISTLSFADNQCVCKKFQKLQPDQPEIINMLENSELQFEAEITSNAVRGVLGARYYYCENDEGFLLVQLNDKEVLYKEVPLQAWFEFKFANDYTSFYRERIKFDFISI